MTRSEQVHDGLTAATTLSAWIGGITWCVFVALDVFGHGIQGGWIDRLFLLAPLIVLPLALWTILKISRRGDQFLFRWAVYVQFPAALSLVVAFGVRRPALTFLPEDPRLSIYLTVPWLVFCAMLVLGEFLYVWTGKIDDLTDVIALPAMAFLPVGGFWLAIDQAGILFMGITAPIRLLTGVHFHFTGFGVPVLLAGLHFLFVRTGRDNRAFMTIVAASGVVAGIPMVAMGFLHSDMLKSVGVIVLSVSLVTGALLLYHAGRLIEGGLRATFVRTAAVCVVAGMLLATVFQVSLHLGRPVLGIPVMTVTHGVLNGVGFLILGLIGLREIATVAEEVE